MWACAPTRLNDRSIPLTIALPRSPSVLHLIHRKRSPFPSEEKASRGRCVLTMLPRSPSACLPVDNRRCGAQRSCSAGNLPAIILFSIRRIEKHHNFQFSIFNFQLSRPALCAGEKTSAKGFQWTPFSDILNSDKNAKGVASMAARAAIWPEGPSGSSLPVCPVKRFFGYFVVLRRSVSSADVPRFFCAFHTIKIKERSI